MRAIAWIAVALAALLLGSWLLWPADEEAGIRAAIAAMEDAAARRDAAGVLRHVSADYRGEGGDRSGLGALLHRYFAVSESLSVRTVGTRIRREGARATLSTRVVVGRIPVPGGDENRPEDLLDAPEIEARLVRESDGWKVVSARRTR